MASAVSADLKFTVWQVASYSRAWAREDSAPTWSWALIIDNASGGPEANREAHSSTALSSSTAGTTRFTNPNSSASAAEMTSAKYASSNALCSPTRRGSTQEPPQSNANPRFEKISEKRASSEATTRSQPNAKLALIPAATPGTLAI